MKLIHRSAGLLSALISVGCAQHPTPELDNAPLPIAWRNAGNFPTASPTQDLSRWWSTFGDQEMSALIHASLTRNPDILSAIASVRQAQALRQQQASLLFPTVDYSGSANAGRKFNRKSDNTSSESYSAGLSASWEVDLFGKNRQSLIAATADADAAVEDLNSVRASLAAETALAYLQLRSAEASLGVVKQSIASQEQTSQLAEWRSQAGEIDELELEQTRASLESSRAALTTLQQSIAQSQNQLNLLAGRTPGALKISSAAALPQPGRRLAIGIPTDTIRQRPDVRSSGYTWLAAIARTRSAEAEQLPSLKLSGTLGIESLSAAKIFDPQTLAANAIAGLSGPIFNAGQIRAHIAGQDAAEERAFQQYRSSILTALSEVEDALIACQRSGEKITILEKAASSARIAAKLSAQKYAAGVIDITPVLDTQRSELLIEQNLVTARLDHSSAYIALYRALGGGW